MKVGDFVLDYTMGNVYSCCENHLLEHASEPTNEGHILECEYCGAKMKLCRGVDGKLCWRGMK
jgi:hypothetical protein